MAKRKSDMETVGPENSVNKRMKMLLETGNGYDMIIRCQGKEFKVHRGILQSVGGYFAGVSSETFEEGAKGLLTLDDSDCASGPMLAVLQYIYSDSYVLEECSQKGNHLLFLANLERLAKRFLLPSLGNIATDALSQMLKIASTDKNFAECLKTTLDYVYKEPDASGEGIRAAFAEALVRYKDNSKGVEQDLASAFRDDFPLASDLLQASRTMTIKTKRMYAWKCEACGEEYYTTRKGEFGRYSTPHTRCAMPGCGSTNTAHAEIKVPV